MDQRQFKELMGPVLEKIAGKGIAAGLESDLNRDFPAGDATFQAIEAACMQAIEQGWMCAQGSDGRRFGRVVEPAPETHNLSVDVVDITDFVGPHHRHPTGEVCMVMPLTENARSDGHGAGWCVNPPGTAHHPTVTEGRALVLYLLPDGKIEFTG